MKIAVYKDNLSTGRGADTAVKNFANALKELGYDTELFDKTQLQSRLECDFDIVVITGSNEAVDLDRLGYFSRPSRGKVILQLHLAPKGFFKWRHPFRNQAIKKAFNKVDVAQVLCQSYVPQFKSLAPAPQVVVIPNWTDMRTPEGFQTRYDSKTILYPAAALNKNKNQKFLIRAFAKISKDFPEWKLRLLGKDTTKYGKACRMLVAKSGMIGKIEIAGFSHELVREYSAASFIAFPSNLEGFPLALLEAAEFGLCAIVQKDLPGATDIVQNGVNGLVSRNNISEYSDKLSLLMSNMKTREELGLTAKAHCNEEYSREKCLKKWESLLNEVCKR